MRSSQSVCIALILSTISLTSACIFGSSADCFFQCHCASNASCDVTTGQCPGQCEAGLPQPSDDVTRYDWRGPACQIGNVALNKSAEQSGAWYSLVAGNAVDGRLGDEGSDGDANCAHPVAGSGSLAWWRVDLGFIHAILNVTVFNTFDEGGGAVRMEEFVIGVGNTTDVTEHALCASHVSPAVAAGGNVTLTCNSPLFGRYVSFRRTGGNQPDLVTICEFVVMGYKQTYAACGNCASNICDDVLGCMECSPFYSNMPICDEGCAAGFYGDGCSSTCGSCNGSAPCRYNDGTCPNGCQQWYTGDKCDLYINERLLSANQNPSTAIASSSTSIDVEWKSEDNITESLVSYYGYVVKYGLSGSDNKTSSNDVPHQSNQSHHSITISGLQSATTYDFKVFIYREQNGVQEARGWGANKVTATTLGSETTSTSTTTQVTTKTSQSIATTSTTTTTVATTTSTTPTTTTSSSTTTTTKTTTPTTTTSAPTTTPSTIAIVPSTTTTTATAPTTTSTTPTTTTSSSSTNTTTTETSSPTISASPSAPQTATIARSLPVSTSSPQAPPSSSITPYMTTSMLSEPTDPEKSEGSDVTTIGIAAGLSCFAVTIIVIIIVVILIRRKVPRDEPSKSAGRLSIEVLKKTGGHVTTDPPASEQPEPPTGPDEPDGCTYIPVVDLATRVTALHAAKDGFGKEFANLPRENYASFEVGNQTANYNKNRFANIRPYDDTRVVLNVTEDDHPHAHYINASHIKVFKTDEVSYIATQGPKPATLPDFWRLVWQENVNRIVMVTALVESAVKKCEQYWPSGAGESKTYGKITVTTAVDDTYADYAYRLFRIQHGEDGQTRDVHHLHFLSWIDKNRPEEAFTLLDFRRRIRSFDSKATGPLLVHCSAGVGRTGTLIALDRLLDQAATESHVDVYSCVHQLRTQRMWMVQTLSQYTFLYECLTEGIECGNKAIPCDQFDERYKTLKEDVAAGPSLTPLEEEFQLITRLKLQMDVSDDLSEEDANGNNTMAGTLPENKAKNRNSKVIPRDLHRPCLLVHPNSESSDYINAIILDSYTKRAAILLTQMPLEHTVADFWRLVLQQKCDQIVMLNTTNFEDPSCVAYWPDGEENTANYEQVEVELTETNTNDYPNIVIRNINVVHCKDTEDEEIIKVRHYQLQSWPHHNSLPPHPAHLLELIEILNKGSHSNSKLLIQCTDGAERSGLFAAAKYMVDKLKVDQDVDVFLACRNVTSRRHQAINTMEQYKFLYDLAQTYTYDFGQYANFTKQKG